MPRVRTPVSVRGALVTGSGLLCRIAPPIARDNSMTGEDRSRCRFCGDELTQLVVDLGMSPLCQTQIKADELNAMERFYPLRVHVCHSCFLVQLDEYVSPDNIFTEYPYFSSYSDSWVAHAKAYCVKMRDRMLLDHRSSVYEVASNDGYLLQHFVAMNIPVLGIEPAANVAEAAREKGIRTEVTFLRFESAKKIVDSYGQADLVLGNNVLAHVPDINDFVRGLATLLKAWRRCDDGVSPSSRTHGPQSVRHDLP